MTDNQSAYKANLIFSLARLKSSCAMTASSVDFNPPFKYKSIYCRPNGNTESIIPRYNNDGNCFTRSFFLPSDQVPIYCYLRNT